MKVPNLELILYKAQEILIKDKEFIKTIAEKKNNGYQDKTEYVLTPNQQNDNDYSPDEIRQRYITANQHERLSDSDSDEDSSND